MNLYNYKKKMDRPITGTASILYTHAFNIHLY